VDPIIIESNYLIESICFIEKKKGEESGVVGFVASRIENRMSTVLDGLLLSVYLLYYHIPYLLVILQE
jgi:hypothetical protein